MIRRSLVLAALLLMGGAAASSAQTPAGTEPVRPRVAQLVRAGLSAPGDSAVWTEMAHLLPEMARTDGADVMASFEASRLADSISRSPFDPMAAALSANRSTGAATSRSAGPVTSGRTVTSAASAGIEWGPFFRQALPFIPWVVVGLIALVIGGLKLNRTVRRVRIARSREDSKELRAARDSKSRLWAVTALAASGLPPTEIARRTGMAQDAVRVLMGLQTPNPVPIGPHKTAAPARPRSPGEQAAGISAQRAALIQQASRMRDGRITYGRRATR